MSNVEQPCSQDRVIEEEREHPSRGRPIGTEEAEAHQRNPFVKEQREVEEEETHEEEEVQCRREEEEANMVFASNPLLNKEERLKLAMLGKESISAKEQVNIEIIQTISSSSSRERFPTGVEAFIVEMDLEIETSRSMTYFEEELDAARREEFSSIKAKVKAKMEVRQVCDELWAICECLPQVSSNNSELHYLQEEVVVVKAGADEAEAKLQRLYNYLQVEKILSLEVAVKEQQHQTKVSRVSKVVPLCSSILKDYES
ncbi:hypothetical protein ACLOJK_010056 [Asimina triloba]